MYFNTNNQNTNIDNEFKNNKKKKKSKGKEKDSNKKLLIIIGACIGVLVLILLIVLYQSNKVKYYIDLNGQEDMTVYQGDLFVDPGYRGYDNKGNDLTDEVRVEDTVDTSNIGEYYIEYTLSSKVKRRIVKVIEKPADVTLIYLVGGRTVNFKVGEEYRELGYKASDNIDGDLTNKVMVSGSDSVDTSKAGVYKINYTVTNSRNVTTTVQRIVIVK